MILFSRVRGLPVVTDGEAGRLGVVRDLTVDAAAGAVTRLRVRRGRLRGEAAPAWQDVIAVRADRLVVRPGAGEDTAEGPSHHDLLGRRVLTETGEERGTVLDAAFDPVTGRIETIRTTLAELPADRMLGLGDHALVVRATRTDRV
ncbi:PRC-barrel domain-containing protein [Streptomyces sp. NPDC052013]|uniref:PRC-barrel domain-containing protein n=1 Tax=Streptomyces sp. NPDC052013 TaxID=3365679 RepID=UPI0037D40819